MLKNKERHKEIRFGVLVLCHFVTTNKGKLDMAQRRNKASADVIQCLQWLELWPQNSVVYACLGKQSCIAPMQLSELAVGLEASNRTFIWVIREGYKSDEFKKWLSEEEFEERTEGRGLLIQAGH
ncbi:hypothetical protein CRYUN_Cryun16bG0111400 [Craigia yunnanensis]